MNQIVELENTAPCGLPLVHTFSDGIYHREIFMPKGMLVIGKKHKTEHLNIIVSGKARVWDGEKLVEITAPYTFNSGSGVTKVLYILEDMLWQTVHTNPNNERDIIEIEDRLVEESDFNICSLSNDVIKLLKGVK